MWQGLTGIHLLVILGIVILLFGATKLPALAKGLGQSINIFKKEMETDDKRTKGTDAGVQNTVADPAAPVAQPVVNPAPTVQPTPESRNSSQI
ncbi:MULTISPECIES: twin-arginine translocase TatA/TatE family subunit [unclassified Curtobacterium]|uniref:twin-arginine translocase TatA/TatE family subunit n=1 Tax=unclassified Curtobacterium TaxID=257496 RepID=UPI0008DD9D89|nr:MULTISPECIES: twin-arginine translocase TatA/TatE family subunit [unclassified Curtobacterium]OIH95791.1 hypothetical protein BIU92_04670 [Curtobacterium sp. MCBA15_003]OII33540.1 hypothetical protein BIU94_00080 [Curtobacterium sp. MMLR14_006]WIE65344.1 twin-arginine translocase TatA/TatE family subunit [Curtobacterium sp. MCLR17_036]